VIEPSSGCVDQITGEELDDKKVVVRPTLPTREAVVLQPNTGIDLAIVLDNIVGHPKTLREACIAHVAPERFRPMPLRAKTALFSVIASTTAQVVCTVLGACPLVPP
jgi:hypothetical protein